MISFTNRYFYVAVCAFTLLLLIFSCTDNNPSDSTVTGDVPSIPTNVTAFAGDQMVTITWDTVPEANSYNIYWSNSPTVTADSNKLSNVTCPVTHSPLINNTTYYYRVSAKNDYGEGKLSAVVNATPLSGLDVPPVPANVQVTAADTTLYISWDSSAGATAYTLYWSDSSVVNETSASIDNVTSPYTHTGLTNQVTYYYRVSAWNQAGESELSPTKYGTPTEITSVPNPPNNIKVYERDSTLTLTWDSSINATLYNVYWSYTPDVTKLDFKEIATSTPFDLINLKNGTPYYIKVSAQNDIGEGQLSTEVNGTPMRLTPPDNFTLEADYKRMILKWDAVSNATSYNLYWSNIGYSYSSIEKITNVTSPFTHDSLDPSKWYYYRIVSANPFEESYLSDSVAGFAGLETPSNISIDSAYKTLTLHWRSVSHATSYNIYWDTVATVTPASHKETCTTTTFIHSNLAFNTLYYYRISAQNTECESALSDTVHGKIKAFAPIAYAGNDTSVSINDSLDLHGTGIDSNGTIITYEWKFSDGTWVITSTGDTTILTPATSQYYVCSLRVTDDEGLTGFDAMTVTVTASPPSVKACDDTTVGINNPVHLYATCTDNDGAIVQYAWKFWNNAWVITSTADTTLPAPSTAQVCVCSLRVTDDDGLIGIDTVAITIEAHPPEARAGRDTLVGLNEPVNLHGYGFDLDGTITKYEWRFGSNDWKETSSGDTTITAPSTAQFYVCSLRVTDDDGLTGSDAVVVTVGPPTITDIDGNVYKTVQIGEQIWTIDNLRTTKYNDGTEIPRVTGNTAWSELTSGAYCYTENTTDPDTIVKYGAFYNWYAVETGKLAPSGWHVPTNQEWSLLQFYLQDNGYNWDGTTSGNKIGKSLAAKTNWKSSNTEGDIGNDIASNNSSGFSALPVGWRKVDGLFISRGSYALFWGSTEAGPSEASLRRLDYNDVKIVTGSDSKIYGSSVRLIKD